MFPEEIQRILDQADAERLATLQAWAKAITEAEKNDPSKQRFVIAELRELYDPSDGDVPADDPERDLRLAYRYWVQHPALRTLAEFADLLNQIDGSGSG